MVAIVSSHQYLSSFYNGVPSCSQQQHSYKDMPSLYDIEEGDEDEVEMEKDFAFALQSPKRVPTDTTHEIESSCSDEEEQLELEPPTPTIITPPFLRSKKNVPLKITDEKRTVPTATDTNRRTSNVRVTFAPDEQLAECIVIDRIDSLLEDANEQYSDDVDTAATTVTTVNDIWYKSDELTQLRILEYRSNCTIQSYYGPGHALEPHNLTWRGMEDAQFGEDRMEPIETYVKSVLRFIDALEMEEELEDEEQEQARKLEQQQALADHAMSISQGGQAMALAQGFKDEWDAQHPEEDGLYEDPSSVLNNQNQGNLLTNHLLAMFDCV